MILYNNSSSVKEGMTTTGKQEKLRIAKATAQRNLINSSSQFQRLFKNNATDYANTKAFSQKI